jgi:hypothetical protein
MQLGEISFCDKIGYNVRSDEIKRKILYELENEYQFRVIQKHFEKYNPDVHTDILKKQPFLVGTRTNGNPYLLYLTKINFVNQCIFIDKKIQQGYHYPRMIVAQLWFDDELFENTLFDGEMIKDDNGAWTYLIGDLIADSGSMLQKQNLIKRINRVYEIIQDQYVHDSINVCTMKVKKYFTYNQIDELINDFIPKLKYTVRGVYFKPLFLKFRDILYNFNDSLIVKVQRFKYKEQGAFLLNSNKTDLITLNKESPNKDIHHSMTDSKSHGSSHNHIPVTALKVEVASKENEEYWVIKTSQPDIYELYDDTNAKIGIACCNTMSTSKMLHDSFKHSTAATKLKFVCQFHHKFHKWRPIHQVI